MLFCTHFRKTSVVALNDNNRVVGFVSGYRPPVKVDALFIWQVAVDASMRGRSLAPKIIDNILNRAYNKDIKFIHATVTPSNKPSERLFRKLAEIYNTRCKTSLFFKGEYFCHNDAHEDEYLFNIGPIR
jgi:L-2,4-diaminobutyric acid acetyltransferase